LGVAVERHAGIDALAGKIKFAQVPQAFDYRVPKK